MAGRAGPQSLRALLSSGTHTHLARRGHGTPDHFFTNRSSRSSRSNLSLSIQSRRQFGTSVARTAQPAPSPSPSPSSSTAASSPPATARSAAKPSPSAASPTASISNPLPDLQEEDSSRIDWSKSFHGLSTQPFSKEIADILLAPIDAEDVEIKPDGIIFLPEIKYRRILNRAFGPGGWGLAPRSETVVTDKSVTREYALVAHGRLVSIARGEQDYFSKDGIPTASEGCKSNAMMRCCKDLGIASELWDPRFIRKFKASHTREVFVEHLVNKKKTKIWLRKGDPVSYPWRESKFGA